VRANLRSVAAVGAAADSLRAALGAAEAEALLDAAQRAAVTPSELEVPAARLTVGERLGAGSFGKVSWHHIWLRPPSCTWLQSPPHIVAASATYGCSLRYIWMQVHAARLDGGERLALKRVSLVGLPPVRRGETEP